MAEQFSRNTLTILNKFSSFMEIFELSSPFMLCYEIIDQPNNSAALYMFSPNQYSHQFFKYEDSISEYRDRALHRHNFYEIGYVLEGTFKQTIENETFLYHAGDCSIMNCNTSHRESFSGFYKIMCIMLTEDFLRHLHQGNYFCDSNRAAAYKMPQIFHLLPNKDKSLSFNKEYINYSLHTKPPFYLERLEQLIDQILAELSHRQPGNSFIIEGLLIRFLFLLENSDWHDISNYNYTSSNEEGLFSEIVQILESCHGRISRTELEMRLNYSSDYLNRIIKRFTGLSFVKFSQTFYLKEAETLLLTTDKSISEIIDRIGFTNRNHFYKLFQDKNNMSPQEFRDRNQRKL